MSTDTTSDQAPLTVEELRKRTSINVEEAARVLGLARSTAYDAVHRGDIPSLRVGRRLLVPTGKLLRLLGQEP